MIRSPRWMFSAAVLLVAAWLATRLLAGADPSAAAPAADRSESGMKTVRDFGAVGDGVADDTAAIQRAVDSGAGDIVLPRGRYRLTRPIVVDLNRAGPVSIVGTGTATLVMEAAGPAIRLVGTHRRSAHPSEFQVEVWEKQRMPVLRDFAIEGAHEEAGGVELTGTMQATLGGLHVRRALHGIRLTGGNRNLIVSNCHIYHNRGIGLFFDKVNLHQTNVTGCHISYNGGGGIVVRDSEIRNLHVGTCDIEGNMDEAAPGTANIDIDARSGSVLEGSITGCTIQHFPDDAGSANIRIVGPSPERSRLAGHWTITGNILSHMAVNIHLKNVRGASIIGNTMWEGYEHNLLLEGCTAIQVGTNNLDRNPLYDEKADHAVLFADCSDCTVTGLHVSGVKRRPGGVVLRRCRWFNVADCTILDCDGAGILLDETEHTRVAGCLIRGAADGTAIAVKGGRGNVVAGNVVAGAVRIDDGAGAARDNAVTQ